MPRGHAVIYSKGTKRDFIEYWEKSLLHNGYSFSNPDSNFILVWNKNGEEQAVDKESAFSMLINDRAMISFWKKEESEISISIESLTDELCIGKIPLDGFNKEDLQVLYFILHSSLNNSIKQEVVGFYIDRDDLIEIISEQLYIDISEFMGEETIFDNFIKKFGFHISIINKVDFDQQGIVFERNINNILKTFRIK